MQHLNGIFKKMRNTMLILMALRMTGPAFCAERPFTATPPENGFLGMWGMNIEGGGVGWLNVHEKEGFLDGDLLWIGGSVLPVSDIYLIDENTLVVTRTNEQEMQEGKEDGRKHIRTYTLRVTRTGDEIKGTMSGPSWEGMGEQQSAFTGKRMPPPGPAPDLNAIKYGKPIQLFNGKNLDGWKPIDSGLANGFKVVDGTLQNDPAQSETGEHVSYGNLRTEKEFEDFNLKLEVNVPKGNNSGVYLRGLYEIQVVDSYGLPLDSHNMGAVYSRITPTTAAEKPAGQWQTLDILLVDRHISVTFNGKKIVDNQPVNGPTGGAISSDVFGPGPIYLQGDHGSVAYRNVVLTPVL